MELHAFNYFRLHVFCFSSFEASRNYFHSSLFETFGHFSHFIYFFGVILWKNWQVLLGSERLLLWWHEILHIGLNLWYTGFVGVGFTNFFQVIIIQSLLIHVQRFSMRFWFISRESIDLHLYFSSICCVLLSNSFFAFSNLKQVRRLVTLYRFNLGKQLAWSNLSGTNWNMQKLIQTVSLHIVLHLKLQNLIFREPKISQQELSFELIALLKTKGICLFGW